MAKRNSATRSLTFVLSCLFFALTLPNVANAVDMWGIKNPSVSWHQGSEGMAVDGACYGMVLAAKTYHELGLDKVRPFSDVAATSASKGMSPQAKELYLEQFAALAQNYALRNRNAQDLYSLPTDHQTVDRGLSAVSQTNPEILILTNHAAVAEGRAQQVMGHAVLVQGREENDQTITYKISDPNFPNTEKTISYDKATGAYSGLGGYDTLRHDTTKLPPQNAKWMEALLKGAAQPQGREYLPVWRGNTDMPKTEIEYKKETQSGKGDHTLEPPVPSPGVSNGMSALKPDEVGGVRLYFDPTIVIDDGQSDSRWEMVNELVSRITEGKENFLLQLGGTRDLQAVSLSSILRQGTDLGGLTRVLGFARNRKTGEIYLLGKTEPETPAITLDTLSVALQVMWKGNATPAVSLDPNPDDFFGPQHVRLEGFPAEYGNTEFTNTMLEADYEMKRIMLGEDRLDIDGYTSFVDLIAKHPEQLSGEYFRWWLYPKETSGASVYRITRGDMDVCFYDSDVKVLTETMKREYDGLNSTGQQEPMAEEGSLLFTSHYAQIEQARPIFRQLHGVFDVAKLAAVLRAEGASDKIFTDIAGRSVQSVLHKDSYEGIGPKFIPCDPSSGFVSIFTGGGVATASPLRAADLVTLDGSLDARALDSLEQSREDRVSLSLDLPSNIALDPNNVRLADGDMESFRALDEIKAGDLKSAIDRLDRVILTDPGHLRAHVVRSVANMAAGDRASALKDIDIAIKAEPALKAFRGTIRLAMGDEAGGLADVRAASQEFPDHPDVLMQKALAEMMTMDLADAQIDYERARVMMPLDSELAQLGKQLRLLKIMGNTQGKALLKAQMGIPIVTSLKLTHAMQLSSQGMVPEAIRLITEIAKTVQQMTPGKPDALYLEERCWVLLATEHFKMGTSDHVAIAKGYINRLAKKHPTWPSGVLFSLLDLNMPFKQAVQTYVRGAKIPDAGDPLLLDTRVRSGINLKAQVGFQLVMAAAKSMDTDKSITVPMVDSLIDQTVAACPPGPARYILALIKKSLNIHYIELKGKKFNKAEYQRLDNEFKEAILNVPPVPPQSDGINLTALDMTVGVGLERICRDAKNDADYKDANRLFSMIVRDLDSDWAFASSLDEAAQASVNVHALYAGMLTNRVKYDSRLAGLKGKYAKGEIETSDLMDGVDAIVAPIIDAQHDVSNFTRLLLHAEFYARCSEIRPDVDAGKLGREIILRQSHIAKEIEDSAKATVEIKSAADWFTAQDTSLAEQAMSDEAFKSVLVDFHRRASRLDNRYAKEAALH